MSGFLLLDEVTGLSGRLSSEAVTYILVVEADFLMTCRTEAGTWSCAVIGRKFLGTMAPFLTHIL